MEKKALSDDAFGEFAEQVVLLLHNTSRVKGDAHQGLLREKGGGGFPYLVFLDQDGEVMAPQPYSKFTVDGFQETLGEDVPSYRDLKRKALSGDRAARIDRLMRQVEFGSLSAKDAKAALSELRDALSEDQLAKLEERFKTAQLFEAIAGLDLRDPTDLGVAGPKVLALYEADQAPGDERAFSTFRYVLLEFAASQKDVKLFAEVLDVLRQRYADNERAMKQIVEPTEKRLEKLKEGDK